MTGPDHELYDDEPTLPERDLLEAWEVPMTSPELTDHIMTRLDGSTVDPSPRSAPRRGQGRLDWPVVAVGMVAAAALVLALARPGSSPPAELPAVAAVTEPGAVAPAASAGPAASVPTLVVRTEPADAAVHIDGVPVAGPSPFSISGLRSGAHRLTVEREGYLPVERTVEGGMATELPIELPRRDVVLSIAVDPPEATVTLLTEGERVEIGSDGGRHLLERRAGLRYEVEASAPGFQTRRIALPLTGRADQEVRLSLVPDPAGPEPESKSSRSRRSGASGTSPDLKDPFGGRRGREPAESTLMDPFSAGDGAPEPVELARLRIGTGAGDPPAKVFVDGKLEGTTPIMAIEVEPGRHRVEFRFPDGRSKTVMVTVEAGETTVVKSR
ncbi:MAG: PEGA domain-containing protein [Nannocystaceae bacterium]